MADPRLPSKPMLTEDDFWRADQRGSGVTWGRLATDLGRLRHIPGMVSEGVKKFRDLSPKDQAIKAIMPLLKPALGASTGIAAKVVDPSSAPFAMAAKRVIGEPVAEMLKQGVTAPARAYEGKIKPDEMFGEAWNAALMTPVAAAVPLAAVSSAGKGSLGVFAGRMSKTADLAKLDRAKQMSSIASKSREEIFAETGWFQGKDKVWRYEIDDSKSIATPLVTADSNLISQNKRGKWLTHPALYKAYPRLRGDKMSSVKDDATAGNASFNQSTRETTLKIPEKQFGGLQFNPRGTMLHEATHGVQGIENMAAGSSSSMTVKQVTQLLREYRSTGRLPPGMTPKSLDELASGIASAIDETAPLRQAEMFKPREVGGDLFVSIDQKGVAQKLYNSRSDAKAKSPKGWKIKKLPAKDRQNYWEGVQAQRNYGEQQFELYRREAGEVEARNVDNRQRLTAEERKRLPPWKTQDVPDDRQWVAPHSRGFFANDPKATAPLGAVAATRPRASPQEITRAAGQSHGLTQQGLRDLYGELGLSGQPPSGFVGRSLATKQPPRVVEEAIALKLEDRAALDALSPEQRRLFKSNKPAYVDGEKFLLPSQRISKAASKEREPLIKEVKKAEIEYDAQPLGFGDPMFDLSARTLGRTPDVGQFPLPRLEPKITERLRPAFAGGSGLRRIEEASRTAPSNIRGWYNLEQTRRDFHSVHGAVQGEQIYAAWLDSLAGTSMLNPISNNVRASSFYLNQMAEGKALPEVTKLIDPRTGQTVSTLAGAPPAGYGAKAEVQHAQRVRQLVGNTGDPVKNAKPLSYRQNLGGNWKPRTVDTHDIRNMIGMPRALRSFNDSRSALLPGEYSALEGLGGRAASRAGVPQASQQARTWIGGGEYTGLKSVPLPVQAELQRRIMVTAKVYGMNPSDVYSGFMRGEVRLLSGGSSSAPLSLMPPREPRQQQSAGSP